MTRVEELIESWKFAVKQGDEWNFWRLFGPEVMDLLQAMADQ